MLRYFLIIGLLICVPSAFVYADQQWHSLDGPYWANGIDVAVGYSSSMPGNRYLIGRDKTDTNIYSWNNQDSKWHYPYLKSGANKIISYKQSLGTFAFCSVYEDAVYKTIDGGENWTSAGTPSNSKYTSIEVLNMQTPTNEVASVFVGTEPYQSLATVYYSVDAGTNWDRLGGDQQTDPIYGLHIYDIESLEDLYLSAGTSDGLFTHPVGSYGTSWTQVAFDGFDVIALETVDLHHNQQLAAVVTDQGRKLYYTPNGWTSYQEVLISGQSFDKEVQDITGTYWYGPEEAKSFYIATTEGIFLLKFELTLQNVELLDLATDASFGYNPFRYDNNFVAVDYYFYFETGYKHNVVLASTPFNVYEIHETRESNNITEIYSIEYTDVVTGTYICDVISAEFPGNTDTIKEIFTVSDFGLIKKMDADGWKMTGFAFDGDGTGVLGTDITIDQTDRDGKIMVSSKTSTGGTIMYSPDGGATWYDRTPFGDPIINTVDFDVKVGSDYVYAAGDANQIWYSSDNGQMWGTSGSFTDANFQDVFADPYYSTTRAVYFGGEGNPKSTLYDGSTWYSNENGLSGVDTVFQFAKYQDFNDVYIATDMGIYKKDMSDINNLWSARTNGTGPSSMVSIINDPQSQFSLLAATNDDYYDSKPRIYASCDSARNWIRIFNGDLADLENDIVINELVASRDDKSGYLALTNLGVFYLDDVFRGGDILANETWGPGKLFIYDNVEISGGNLSVIAPCSVYVSHDFDYKIALTYGNTLDINGVIGDSVLITSNRVIGSSVNPSAGDWYGILIYSNGTSIDVSYSILTGANSALTNGYSTPDYCSVENSRISKMSFAGLDLSRSALLSNLLISNNIINDCGEYGIRISRDNITGLMSTTISNNTFDVGKHGIWYSGNSNSTGTRKLIIKKNTINRNSFSLEKVFGIYITKYSSSGYDPISEIDDNTIDNFDAGIRLNTVNNPSYLKGNIVKNNKSYGLYLSNSSPKIYGASVNYNAFNNNYIGIYCNKSSNPYVRWTQIKESIAGGVLIDARYNPFLTPDFGTYRDWGYNSFYKSQPSALYYDMKNNDTFAMVKAEYNWWGEPIPNPLEIIGLVDYSPNLTVDPLPGVARFGVDLHLPTALSLKQNYPNPFNPQTKISFYVVEPGFVNLKIFNLLGQEVKELVSGDISSGEHTVIWDGRNQQGTDVSSGIYFYVLSSDNNRVSKRMTLIR